MSKEMTKNELLVRIYDVAYFLEHQAVPRSLEYETAMEELDDLYAELKEMEFE